MVIDWSIDQVSECLLHHFPWNLLRFMHIHTTLIYHPYSHYLKQNEEQTLKRILSLENTKDSRCMILACEKSCGGCLRNNVKFTVHIILSKKPYFAHRRYVYILAFGSSPPLWN